MISVKLRKGKRKSGVLWSRPGRNAGCSAFNVFPVTAMCVRMCDRYPP